MIGINFLHADRSATFMSRFGRGISASVITPILSMTVVITAMSIALLIQIHQIKSTSVIIDGLQRRANQVRDRIHSENVDIAVLRTTIHVDTQIAAARDSGVLATNFHVRIANALDTHLRLKSITNGSPTVLSGLAPSYSSVGRTIERLSSNFASRQITLESVHRVPGIMSSTSVAFVLRVSSATLCCGGVK